MDVIVIESEAFKQLVGMFETILKTVSSQSEELKSLKDNRLMSVKDTCSYMGFSKSWLMQHKEDIGYSQIGCKDLRFYKEDVDKYFLQHKVQRKYK